MPAEELVLTVRGCGLASLCFETVSETERRETENADRQCLDAVSTALLSIETSLDLQVKSTLKSVADNPGTVDQILAYEVTALDASSNEVASMSGLGQYSVLHTLNLSGNVVASLAAVRTS